MKDFYLQGKKIGEYKYKNNVILCYKPNKKISTKHQTVETIKQMKEFFQKQWN